jgi:hypothetical protein
MAVVADDELTRIQKFDKRVAPYREQGMTVAWSTAKALRDVRRERRSKSK